MKKVYYATMGADKQLGVLKGTVVYENASKAVVIMDGSSEPSTIPQNSIYDLNTPEGKNELYLTMNGGCSRYYNQNPYAIDRSELKHNVNLAAIAEVKREIETQKEYLNSYKQSVIRIAKKIEEYSIELAELEKERDQYEN